LSAGICPGLRYNTVIDSFENAALAPILRGLIVRSSLPLKAVEENFAVDSSGFSTSRFVRWFDHKYGVTRQKYDWVKCHLMCGVKTNVVTAVEIGGRYEGDCPHFAPMVRQTAAAFKINEVSADGAYCSYENMDLVAALGGTPFVNFPANTTAAEGGMMATMFHLYNLNRDEYRSHYHRRSNVESTFSMIKAKFGDSLSSKTDAAMVNEALCKLLAHNLCCLIQSHYELGIAARFWGEDETIEPIEVEPIDEPEEIPIDAWDWV
jgi:transposase